MQYLDCLLHYLFKLIRQLKLMSRAHTSTTAPKKQNKKSNPWNYKCAKFSFDCLVENSVSWILIKFNLTMRDCALKIEAVLIFTCDVPFKVYAVPIALSANSHRDSLSANFTENYQQIKFLLWKSTGFSMIYVLFFSIKILFAFHECQ